MAQQAGLSIAEMHVLVAGFSPEAPASERWQFLARKKLQEVEMLLAHAKRTQQILERLSQCECFHLEECIHIWTRDDGTSGVPTKDKARDEETKPSDA